MAAAIAVTGANGFVGAVMVELLAMRGHRVRAIVRRAASGTSSETVDYRVVGDLGDEQALTAALDGVDAVLHLAARAHVMNDTAVDPDAAFRAANVEITGTVARAAIAAGVRRLVYVSSIKVNGERTTGRPFRPDDRPAPADAYARSKLEAEELLRRTKGIEVCVVRPPLVYGPGAKGNLARLIGLVQRGVPLPFRWVRNRRSIVSVDNLASFLERCAVDERAAGQTFLIADPEPLSTAEMIRHIAAGLGRPARLVPVPGLALRLAAAIAGRRAELDRLLGSMEIDPSAGFERLSWSPSQRTGEGLRAMAAARALQAD